jgi:hypothetical protein
MMLGAPGPLPQEENRPPRNTDPAKSLALVEKPALFLNPELSLLQFQRAFSKKRKIPGLRCSSG